MNWFQDVDVPGAGLTNNHVVLIHFLVLALRGNDYECLSNK